MKNYQGKIIKIKSSENEVKKAIKEYLEFNGWKVYRINNGGQYRGKNKNGKDRYSFAGDTGVPDLYCMKKGNSPLWVETKATGKKPSAGQTEFIKLANVCGARAVCVDSLDMFLEEASFPLGRHL